MANVTIALVQMLSTAHKEENTQRAIAKIQAAAVQGAQIICLQELYSTLYFCHEEHYDHFQLAESIPGPTTAILSKLAATYQVVLIVPLFEYRAPGVYHNTAAILDADGSYLGKYRKMHIPDDPGFHEKFYFTPGDLGYKVFKTKYITIGVLICWDQWYPEAARITALMGATILFYPSAIGWASTQDLETNAEQYAAWQTIQRAHAVANGIYVAGVNRVGKEVGVQFWGGSFVSNPFGTILCQASSNQEVTIIQELDLSKVNHYRTHWPFLRDRRIDAYGPILKRFIDEA